MKQPMSKPKPDDDDDATVTIRIPKATKVEVDKLVAHISTNGWTSIDVGRRDPVTIGAVVMEAVKALCERSRR